jgi:hypothetical protein
MREHVVEILDAAQPVTNDVAKRLAYDGHAEPLLPRHSAANGSDVSATSQPHHVT